MERLGGGHRVLAGHSVDHQEGVVGFDGVGYSPDLIHHLVIDGQPPGGVADHHIPAGGHGLGHASSGYCDRIGGLAEHRDPDGRTEGAELVNRRRTLQIGAHQHRVAALLLEPGGQLGRVGGLARALESGQQHHRGGLGWMGDLQGLAAQGGDQLLVDELDHLLDWVQRPVDLGSHAPLADPLLEAADYMEVDIGL